MSGSAACRTSSGYATCSLDRHFASALTTNKAKAFSNHDETVGAVALELFDQTIFPVEIGLHRIPRRLGAFVRTPVAMLRIGLGHDLGRPDLERAVIAAVEHVDFPTHLREPGRRHVGANAQDIGEQ